MRTRVIVEEALPVPVNAWPVHADCARAVVSTGEPVKVTLCGRLLDDDGGIDNHAYGSVDAEWSPLDLDRDTLRVVDHVRKVAERAQEALYDDGTP